MTEVWYNKKWNRRGESACYFFARGFFLMRKFAVLTDTASDLPDSYYVEHDVTPIRLGFTMDGVSYEGEDGAQLDVKEFYKRLRGGSMPTTYQVTPDQAEKAMASLMEAGKDVLAIAFSSGLSGTYESYVTAAKRVREKYPDRKVVVVDSLCASLGQGLLVDYVLKKADAGATLEETAAYAEEIKFHICHIFTVEDLFHLKRGGRVSAGTAIMGTLLNIKPVLHVDDAGHLIPIGKSMGRKKSISALVDKMVELNISGDDEPVFISHGDCPEDVEFLVSLLKKKFGERQIFIHEIGSVIGTHSGAGTLAVFFMGKHR